MNGMSFLNGYAHDIFVSYVHAPVLGEWTLRLREDLQKALNYVFNLREPGPVFDIWIDEVLRKNLPLTQELKKQVEGSALLLIVMSPSYLLSDWCGKEVSWFNESAKSRVAPSARIFCIHAKPTERTDWPKPLHDLPGYTFFARPAGMMADLLLGEILDETDKAAYKKALWNLADQIKQQIDGLAREAEASAPEPPITPVHQSAPRAAPAALVCLDVLCSAAPGGQTAEEQKLRGVLTSRKIKIFSPASLGVVQRDPLAANQYMQRLLKAKAACDGIILLRLDPQLQVDDWLLDYVSEIWPMARRVRTDGIAPQPLLVDLSPSNGARPDDLQTLYLGDPQFEAALAKWVDTLLSAQKVSA
jgi:hypothetical protein